MAGGRDYYRVLGIPPDADAEAIRDAFRRLARKHHPDASTAPDAAQRFREIAEAHHVLADPRRRAGYDARPAVQATARSHPAEPGSGIDLGGSTDGPPWPGGPLDRLFGRPAPDARTEAGHGRYERLR
jgi:curved DNA-binding protein CbpA